MIGQRHTLLTKRRGSSFFKFLRQLQPLYDILSPDAFLEPFMENYKALVKLHGTIRNAYSDNPYVDKELTAKTKELLYQNISISDLEMPGVIYELGAEELAKLKARFNPANYKSHQ